jgi:hypothetical protein
MSSNPILASQPVVKFCLRQLFLNIFKYCSFLIACNHLGSQLHHFKMPHWNASATYLILLDLESFSIAGGVLKV